MDLLRNIIQGHQSLNHMQGSYNDSCSTTDMFLSSVVRASDRRNYSIVTPNSYYRLPIPYSDNAPHGYSRNWGGASSEVQVGVMKRILEESQLLPAEDRAILLSIARLESGFNPDAAATTTSAAGIFQFVKNTGKAYGLDDTNRFDIDSNVIAGVQHYEDNIRLVHKRFPGLTGNDRAAMIYAFHHDGPSLKYGGQKIGEEKLVPELERFRNLVASW